MDRILVVAAHPDDEVLGCGGTMARLAQAKHEITVLILGEGITSRDETRDRPKREKEIQELKGHARKANALLGVKEVICEDFPDNRFDSVALLDIVKAVEKVKKRVDPKIIFTHYRNDLNMDHRVVYDAVLTASRPVAGQSVKEIYSFEVPSSTEWNYPSGFTPNFFMEISATLDKKILSMNCYESESTKFPHPRSPEGLKVTAQRWGTVIGAQAAEAFEVVRMIR